MDEIHFTFDLPHSFFIDAKETEQHYTVEALHTSYTRHATKANNKAEHSFHNTHHKPDINNFNNSHTTTNNTNTNDVFIHKHKDEHLHHRNSRGA